MQRQNSSSILEQLGGSASERVQRAVDAVRLGRPVLVLDDHDRENEADMIVPAESLTVETMAMMIRHGSGIVCLCLPGERLDRLELPQMVADNTSQNRTAFTVSIEAREGVTTGVCAADRVRTIQVAVHPDSTAADLARPGHVFPLRAHQNGVFGRRGHTEASVDLARMAGLTPAAVLCELMNDDGTMARGSEVVDFAVERDCPILSVDDIVAVRWLLKSALGDRSPNPSVGVELASSLGTGRSISVRG